MASQPSDICDIPSRSHQMVGDRRRWRVLAVLIVCLTPVVLDNTILNVALPSIQRALHASQASQEWMVDAYSLMFASLLVSWGVMADRYGRRRVLAIGIVLFGVASVIAAFSPTRSWLVIARGLMGMGGAATLPATLAIITNVFPPDERSRAIGVWAACSGIAAALGPIVGGLLVHVFWWGSIFLVNIPLVLVGLAGIHTLVPESRDPRSRALDVVGLGLSIAGLFSVVYGIILRGQRGTWNQPEVWGTLGLGVVLLAGFFWKQHRSSDPIFDFRLFRRPAFGVASIALALNFYVLFSGLFVVTYYLQFVRSYSPFVAGALLLPVALALLAFSPISVVVAQRWGTRAACVGGLVLITVACVGSMTIDTDTSLWLVGLLLFIEGVGMASVFAPATSSMMLALPLEEAGVGSAANNTVRQLGGALGLAITGSMLSLIYRSNIEQFVPTTLASSQRAVASESIGGTFTIISRAHLQLTESGRGLIAHAGHAFVHAMHGAFLGLGVVALMGAAITARWMPSTPSDR